MTKTFENGITLYPPEIYREGLMVSDEHGNRFMMTKSIWGWNILSLVSEVSNPWGLPNLHKANLEVLKENQ